MSPVPRFLSVDHVLMLHAMAIEDQGGDPHLRDRGLLESAVATPAQQFGGIHVHPDIPAMAAAYAFHICMNHPFVDGNKRAGVAAMIAFLSDNGWSFEASAEEADQIVRRMAGGALSKADFTDWARVHMREKPRLELRDYFLRVTPEQFTRRFRSLLPAETSASPDEFTQRVKEATVAMPLLVDLARQQRDVQEDRPEWEKITMLAVGMLTLHALAEDMGYEW